MSLPLKAVTNIPKSTLRRTVPLLLPNSQPQTTPQPQTTQTRQTSQCQIQKRHMGTGPRGARGHGWFTKYRSGLGGRHLQGRYHDRDIPKLNKLNDQVFALNEEYGDLLEERGLPTVAYIDLKVESPSDEKGGGEEEQEDDNKARVHRIEIELASAALPHTCGNFAALCTEPAESLGYPTTKVFKIFPSVGIFLGDNSSRNRDGTGGSCHPDYASDGLGLKGSRSIDHESLVLNHGEKGMVSMLSSGVDKNDSRFMITTVDDAPHLDGSYVAFGRVRVGMDVLEDIANNTYTRMARPVGKIEIVSSGILEESDVRESA